MAIHEVFCVILLFSLASAQDFNIFGENPFGHMGFSHGIRAGGFGQIPSFDVRYESDLGHQQDLESGGGGRHGFGFGGGVSYSSSFGGHKTRPGIGSHGSESSAVAGAVASSGSKSCGGGRNCEDSDASDKDNTGLDGTSKDIAQTNSQQGKAPGDHMTSVNDVKGTESINKDSANKDKPSADNENKGKPSADNEKKVQNNDDDIKEDKTQPEDSKNKKQEDSKKKDDEQEKKTNEEPTAPKDDENERK